MDEKRVRIADIAEELGVSTATVSNVIHGKTGRVSAETVSRVQALLEEKQYVPSMAGILLAQNNSRIIGVVINDHRKYEGHVLEDPFVSSSINHLSREIEAAGYFLMIKTTTVWNDIVQFASMWNMEGLVLIGFCNQDYQKLRERMRIPFVVYDGFFDTADRICNLAIDDYDGGLQMGCYFKKLGYTHALCIADNDNCMDHDRLRGFQAGIESGAEILLVPMEKQERTRFYKANLPLLRSADAIFAVSDRHAVELMQFLQKNGIRVPQDVAIAGFDDNPICQEVHPTLTTIRQDGSRRAKLALELLLALKRGQPGRAITLPVELVVRESTGSKNGQMD